MSAQDIVNHLLEEEHEPELLPVGENVNKDDDEGLAKELSQPHDPAMPEIIASLEHSMDELVTHGGKDTGFVWPFRILIEWFYNPFASEINGWTWEQFTKEIQTHWNDELRHAGMEIQADDLNRAVVALDGVKRGLSEATLIPDEAQVKWYVDMATKQVMDFFDDYGSNYGQDVAPLLAKHSTPKVKLIFKRYGSVAGYSEKNDVIFVNIATVMEQSAEQPEMVSRMLDSAIRHELIHRMQYARVAKAGGIEKLTKAEQAQRAKIRTTPEEWKRINAREKAYWSDPHELMAWANSQVHPLLRKPQPRQATLQALRQQGSTYKHYMTPKDYKRHMRHAYDYAQALPEARQPFPRTPKQPPKSDTLVVHLKDPSTDFLKIIYDGLGFDVMSRDYNRPELLAAIKSHERIFMLGHGCPDGLFGPGFLINDEFGPALASKKNGVYIWCNADAYAVRNKLSGLVSGMFISEVGEASMFGIKATQEEVDASNKAFSVATRQFMDTGADPATVRQCYTSAVCKITQFNSERLYVIDQGKPTPELHSSSAWHREQQWEKERKEWEEHPELRPKEGPDMSPMAQQDWVDELTDLIDDLGMDTASLEDGGYNPRVDFQAGLTPAESLEKFARSTEKHRRETGFDESKEIVNKILEDDDSAKDVVEAKERVTLTALRHRKTGTIGVGAYHPEAMEALIKKGIWPNLKSLEQLEALPDPQRNRYWNSVEHGFWTSAGRFIDKDTAYRMGKITHGEDIKESAKQVQPLLPEMAKAAQEVYDAWEQDEQGEDAMLGVGGICQDVAEAVAGVLASHGIEAMTVDNQGMGEQHVWVVAKLSDGVYNIDIEPGTYETGGGYCWKKRAGVVFAPEHIYVDRIDADPESFERYTAENKAKVKPATAIMDEWVAKVGPQLIEAKTRTGNAVRAVYEVMGATGFRFDGPDRRQAIAYAAEKLAL